MSHTHVAIASHSALSGSRWLLLFRLTCSSSRTVKQLGGGISGLVVAHKLGQLLPSTSKITVLDASQRLGGWIHSRQHKLNDGTSVTSELGPRTLRPRGVEGWSAVQLADELGLTANIITVDHSAPAAKKRYIYYPDRLNALPHSLPSLFLSASQPAMQGILHAFLTESLKSSRRDSQSTTDESVDSFVRRRLGPNAADNLISAMIHGIYAGDSRQLSIRAVFPSLWKMETERGSITAGMLLSRFTEETKKTAESIEKIQNSLKQETRNKLRQASVWSLKEGIEGLSTRLIDRLRAMPNVELIPSAKVTSIRTQDQQPIQLEYTSAQKRAQSHTTKLTSSHLVCALPSGALRPLLPTLPHLNATPSVDVGLVNLLYRNPPSSNPKKPSRILPVEGFGYLIPRSTPTERNPHHALGCIFDSDVMPAVDASASTHTKLTMLLGGHQYAGKSQLPSKEDLIGQARETLSMHLGLQQEPAFTYSQMQRSCIPQYTIGHVDRMASLHNALQQQQGNSKISVTGASYTGVSVNDCVYHAQRLGEALAKGQDCTGLEHYLASH